MATLNELQQQRELVARHLAWLEREIAALGGPASIGPATTPSAPTPALQPPTPPAPPSGLDFPKPAPSFPAKSASAAPATTAPEEQLPIDGVTETLIDEYRNKAANSPEDARRGCLILFGSAIAVLAFGVAALWLLKYS